MREAGTGGGDLKRCRAAAGRETERNRNWSEQKRTKKCTLEKFLVVFEFWSAGNLNSVFLFLFANNLSFLLWLKKMGISLLVLWNVWFF